MKITFKLIGGFTLPVGSEANFCLLFLHNDEKYFEEPNKFKPERFEHQERKNPFEYIPFSAGSRNCVGRYKMDVTRNNNLTVKLIERNNIFRPKIRQY